MSGGDHAEDLTDEELSKKLLADLVALTEGNNVECPICMGGEVYPCPKCNPEESKRQKESGAI